MIKKIISDFLLLIPYEHTRYWVDQAHLVGFNREDGLKLEMCEDYSRPPKNLFNKKVEDKKHVLLIAIQTFNETCLDFFQAEKQSNGVVTCRPHYHWKDQGENSRALYYKIQKSVADAGTKLLKRLDEFIVCIKDEGFILDTI